MITTSGPIHYTRLRSGGYRLREAWWCEAPQLLSGCAAQVPGFIDLTQRGRLCVASQYAWDGPSGPTIDTLDFMRGSLGHDALYQLLRAGKLHRSWRRNADKLLYQLCRMDGMSWTRAQWVYWGLRVGAKSAAKRQHEVEELELTAP